MRAATAAAEPAEEPPGVWPRCHGLCVGAGSRYANSVVAVLPRITAPAARSRATDAASRSGRVWKCGRAPAVVGMPATWKMSFTPPGTPCSGPSARPARTSSSRCRAAARAPASSTCTHAFNPPSSARMRARHASTRSADASMRSRTARAASATPSAVGSAEGIEHLRDHLEAAEGRHQVGTRVAPAHLVHESLRHLDTGAQRLVARIAQARAHVVGDGDAGHLVVQELGVTEAVQRHDADEHGRRSAARALEEAVEGGEVVDGLRLQPARTRVHLAAHPLDLAVSVLRGGIERRTHAE